MTPSRWRISLGTQCFFRNPHRIAALALYGQPFGFTRDDVGLLRAVADGEYGGHHGTGRDLHELAAKIAALLPPEGT